MTTFVDQEAPKIFTTEAADTVVTPDIVVDEPADGIPPLPSAEELEDERLQQVAQGVLKVTYGRVKDVLEHQVTEGVNHRKVVVAVLEKGAKLLERKRMEQKARERQRLFVEAKELLDRYRTQDSDHLPCILGPGWVLNMVIAASEGKLLPGQRFGDLKRALRMAYEREADALDRDARRYSVEAERAELWGAYEYALTSRERYVYRDLATSLSVYPTEERLDTVEEKLDAFKRQIPRLQRMTEPTGRSGSSDNAAKNAARLARSRERAAKQMALHGGNGKKG